MWDSSRRTDRAHREYALVILALLLGVTCGPHADYEERTLVPSGPFGLRPVAEWEKLFLGNWETERQGFLPASISEDSSQFYNLAYAIDGNTAMYRATGKTEYLDRALLYIDNVVRSARDSWSLPSSQFKDSYRGWVSQYPGTLGLEVALNESYCWRYVTRLLRVIHDTPGLYNNDKYRKIYAQFLEFSEKDIFEKWFARGANDFIYRENTHMAAHWAAIAMNLSMLTTDDTRKARYLEVFGRINQGLPNYPSSLREQMEANPDRQGAVFWNSSWGSHSQPGQDVAHGNGVVAYIVEAHDAGVEWKDEDVQALAVTLDTVIWPAPKRYAEYLDGSGSGTGWFNDGFMKLGRYSVSLQRRLETHSVGSNTQFYGNAALNVKLLAEKTSP